MTNAQAAILWAAEQAKPVHVVCAGTEGHIGFEDTLLAGEIADRLMRLWRFEAGNDEALIARMQFFGCIQTTRDRDTTWADLLALGRGGRNVQRIGLEPDIHEAARRHAIDLLPVVRRDPVRIERWNNAGDRTSPSPGGFAATLPHQGGGLEGASVP